MIKTNSALRAGLVSSIIVKYHFSTYQYFSTQGPKLYHVNEATYLSCDFGWQLDHAAMNRWKPVGRPKPALLLLGHVTT